jgi:hypothetical protein
VSAPRRGVPDADDVIGEVRAPCLERVERGFDQRLVIQDDVRRLEHRLEGARDRRTIGGIGALEDPDCFEQHRQADVHRLAGACRGAHDRLGGTELPLVVAGQVPDDDVGVQADHRRLAA